MASMDLITEVSTAQFPSDHPELHHYTNFDGLSGILSSQTLWAMNYRHLNDTREIAVLEEPLIEALAQRFRALLADRQRRSPRVRKVIAETGGGVAGIAADQAKRLVRSFYDTVVRSEAPIDLYITSFCTHAHDPYAREDGLLSQWRGYGSGGGYCIVFDTIALVELLKREAGAHYWVMPPKIGRVHYRDAGFSVEEIFAPLLNEAENLLTAFLDGTEIPEIVIAYFLWAAPLLKHEGFREENEARIVAIPATQHDLDALRAVHGALAVPPFKSIQSRPGIQRVRRFVALFETLDPRLPIKRVIVGPSANQDQDFAKARRLLAGGVPVVRSDTPFIV